MGAGKILVIIGAILSIVGTFVFALYDPFAGYLGSGLGFAVNIPFVFENADAIALAASLEVWIVYIVLFVLIIFLAAGVLQFIGVKSRVVGLIFSLFPLSIGIVFILMFYTDILGPLSALFGGYFTTDMFGDTFPLFFTIGGTNLDLGAFGLGAYFLVGGGVLGVVGSSLPKD